MLDLEERLRILDQLQPPDLWQEIELRATVEAEPPEHLRGARRRWQRRRVLIGAVALAALAALVATVVLVRPSQASALAVIKEARKEFAQVPAFRAVIVRRVDRRVVAESYPGYRGGDYTSVSEIVYQSASAWRVNVLEDVSPFYDPPLDFSGNFSVWDGELLGEYDASTRLFYVAPAEEARAYTQAAVSDLDPQFYRWPGPDGTSVPPETYFEQNCAVLPDATIAGRPARHLDCSYAGGHVEIWLDADYGLILRLLALRGATPEERSLRSDLEVRSIEIDPAFGPSELEVVPPPGARVIWAGGGNAPPQYQAAGASKLVSAVIPAQRPLPVAVGEEGVWVGNQGAFSGAVQVKPEEVLVARIDPRANDVVARIPLGSTSKGKLRYPYSLAVGGGAVWAADTDGGLARIDPGTNRLLGEPVQVGSGFPAQLAFGEGAVWLSGGQTVKSSSGGETAEHESVARIDPSTGRVVAYVPVEGILWLGGIAAGEGAVWVTALQPDPADPSRSSTVLYRIDPATNRVVATIDLSGGPVSFFGLGGVAADEGAVWVARYTSEEAPGQLLRIDPRTNAIVARIPVGVTPNGVAVGGGSVWVANQGDDTLTRIDPHTNAVVGPPITTGGGPAKVAVGAGAVWVTNNRDGTVARIDLDDLAGGS